MIGKDLIFDNSLSAIERLYLRIFGVPINGLRIRARRILPLINSRYKKILDAGCGPGIFTFEIARELKNSQVVGIDTDENLIKRNNEIIKKNTLKNCRFKKEDICKMKIINQFDLIISIDNLEHIKNDMLALRKFFEALKKNGEIIIHVPGFYRRWIFFAWKKNFYVKGHFRPGYTKEDINKKVEDAGFKILDSYYTYGWIETVTNNISYLITKAEMKNKILYSLIFPLLNFFSYFGKNSRPAIGAGVLIRAKKL